MTRGKICAQAGHAVLGIHNQLIENNPDLFAIWASLEYPQETYEVKSMQELYGKLQESQVLGIQAYIVHDAGRTQVEPNTPTVCAIGPCEAVSNIKDVDIIIQTVHSIARQFYQMFPFQQYGSRGGGF
ncbi:peptidyl-trna hydrolase [Stylonychia lemnae]|uniref:peptidyl-tRNA hydrolase n=1 Tax=Stylonychia lemnae TaxID=5949 RepID=A0A078A6J8_STYLE|nr:peptidyl-trna hydrolase [Stylonychia lemnae]|eukprot:CDW76359.1 peptidyl-trna hydrolase [Stylonychia lemnae]